MSLQLGGVLAAATTPSAAATRPSTPPPDYAATAPVDLEAARRETAASVSRLEEELRTAKSTRPELPAAEIRAKEEALLVAFAQAAEANQRAGLFIEAADYTKRGGELLRMRFDKSKNPLDRDASFALFCKSVDIIDAGYPALVRSLSGPKRLEARYKLDLCRELLQNLPNGILELGSSLTIADEELEPKKREDYDRRGGKVIDIGRMILRIGRELVAAGAADKGAEYCYASANCLRSVTLGSRKLLKSQSPTVNSLITEASQEMQHCLTEVAGLAQGVLINPGLAPQQRADQLWLLAWARKGKAYFAQQYGFGPPPVFNWSASVSSHEAAAAFDGLARAADSRRPPDLQAAAVALEGAARCFGEAQKAGQAAINWLKLAGVADAEHLAILAGKSDAQLAVGLVANPDNAYRLLRAAKDLVEPVISWQMTMQYEIGRESLPCSQVRDLAKKLEEIARRLVGSDDAMKAIELRVAGERQGVYSDPWAFGARQR